MQFLVFFKAIFDFISLSNMFLMAFAMFLGIIVGTLPGLSATTGLALLTGITYFAGRETAMILMVGLYVGAIFGGSFSAILINIPGTGSAAATCLDGYELAKQGKATDALIITRVASFIGTLFGLICYVLLTPLITALALSFTSAEYFWLGVFGVLICGSLAAPDLPIKGWIAGFIGIMLSYVGMEDIGAYQRFTFGIPQLVSGIPLVPLMVGLFGIPQLVKMIQNVRDFDIMKTSKKSIAVMKTIRQNIIKIIRWGLIGVGIGALPGVGENIAAWAAYGDARKTSKNPEKFGKGAIEGVMAPETANNAAIGGAIIPMLTLGVPGSPPTAILMGALMLHGIRPGPMLKFDAPHFVYQMGAWLFWATIFLLILGTMLAKPISFVLKVPPKILAPLIAVLCIVGTFSVTNDIFDLKLLVLFGIVGYIFDKQGYSTGPLILGFILGPFTDTNLRRVLHLSNGNLLSLINRPISMILFLLTVFMAINTFLPLKTLRKKIFRKKSG